MAKKMRFQKTGVISTNHPPTDFSDMSKTEKYHEQNNNIT